MSKKIVVFLGLVILSLLYWCDPVTATENAGTEPEISTREAAEPGQPARAAVVPEYGQDTGAAGETDPGQSAEAVPDGVSSGGALKEWLEAHKNSGGSVRLTEDVVLEGPYYFCPGRPGVPPVVVDLGNYSITIAGEVEFLSDGQLAFRGQAHTGSLFYVAEGGLLSLSGVSMEGGSPSTGNSMEGGLPSTGNSMEGGSLSPGNSMEEGSLSPGAFSLEDGQSGDIPQYVLWQEEGAGLILDNCRVQGDIHYAETPFALGTNEVCAIAGSDQTAGDVLPAQVECRVNYRGQVQYHQPTAVSWDLTGTEGLQSERLRFSVQGSSSSVAFQQPPVCTVVYNDYPLTFGKVRAFESARSYSFKGNYVKQEDGLPMTIAAEYSFDGENWLVYGTSEESSSLEPQTFFIGISDEQWNVVEQPFVYIRLRGERDGVQYISNVLQYAADNLENAVDQGGTRGGGTSVVNPPDAPSSGNQFPDKDNGNPPGGGQSPGEGNASEGSQSPDRDNGNPPEENTSPEEGDTPGKGQSPDGDDSSGGSRQPGEGNAPGGGQSPDGGGIPGGSQLPDRGNPSGGSQSSGGGQLSEETASLGNGYLPSGGAAPTYGKPLKGAEASNREDLAGSVSASAGGKSPDGGMDVSENTYQPAASAYGANPGNPVELHIAVAAPLSQGRVAAAAAVFSGLFVLGGGAVSFLRARNIRDK